MPGPGNTKMGQTQALARRAHARFQKSEAWGQEDLEVGVTGGGGRGGTGIPATTSLA